MTTNRRSPGGFTLIEVMITMVLITVITSIVYASLSSVVDSTDNARVAAEEMRLRQFLTRHIEWNLAQSYPDWQPGASLRNPKDPDGPIIDDNTSTPSIDEDALLDASYWLEGIDDSGPDGPADRISFSTTAAVSGGSALPGVIKQVTYEIVDQSANDETLLFLEDGSRILSLQCTEVPIFDLASLDEDGVADAGDRESFLEDQEFEAPGWSVPISTMNIRYFDGEEWIDEWDSVVEQRLPWAVQFQINFARPPGEQELGFDPIDDPDMNLIVALPGGLGLTEPPVEPFHRDLTPTSPGGGPPPQP